MDRNEKKAMELLLELDVTLSTIRLDMGGDHRYSLNHRSHRVLTKIKRFLAEVDNDGDI